MFLEKFIHAGAKLLMPLAQFGNLVEAQARTPFQAIANERFEMLIISLMQTRGFPCLDGSENVAGVFPPCHVNGG